MTSNWPTESDRWAESEARYNIARTEGCAYRAGYSRSEYAITVARDGGLVTLAGLRFDQPSEAMRRVGLLLGWA
jgi:hypothetical protein